METFILEDSKGDLVLPRISKRRQGNIIKIRKKEDKELEAEEMLISLFRNDLHSISLIPEKKLMAQPRKRLIDFMHICLEPDTRRYRVKLKDSHTMGPRRYIDIFTKYLFKAASIYSKYSETGKYPLQKILFHGTTTRFLPDILEGGGSVRLWLVGVGVKIKRRGFS